MGRQKIGDLIRRIDYLKAKPSGEYDKREDDPCKQLERLEDECGNITYEELKDAFTVFAQKVAIKEFPDRNTPAHRVAETTVTVLVRLSKNVLAEHEDVKPRFGEDLFRTFIAFIKAGPGSAHCEIMLKMKDFKPLLQDHVKSLSRKDIVTIMGHLKVTFGYTPNKQCTFTKLGLLQRENLVYFFMLFTSEQFSQIHEEFLAVYRHYYLQLPGILEYEEYCRKIYFLIDEMAEKFESKNPYMSLRNTETFKQHIDILKHLILDDRYKKGNVLYDAARKLLCNIQNALEKDGVSPDVFEHLTNVLTEISKNEKAIQEADYILEAYNKCLLKKHTMSVKDTSNRNVSDTVDTIVQYLLSGKRKSADMANELLEALKKSKTFDWKQHVPEAKRMIEAVGDLPPEKVQDDKEDSLWSTVRTYKEFLLELLGQLSRKKVISQLTSSVLDCFFKCLTVNPPKKAAVAEDMAKKDFLDLSGKGELRTKILLKVEKLVKNEDLPWNDMNFTRAVVKILTLAVESFQSGRSVTEAENNIFMSILKTVSDGGDSVLEHFYDEDNHEISNWRLDIFLVGTNDYTRVLMTTRNFEHLVPIMPNILRWAKIAAEEKHNMMKHHMLGALTVLSMASAEQFQNCLPEVMDLMLTTKKTTELFGLVSQTYPQNPKAVHDKMEDIFKIFESCKEDAQRHFAFILNTVAQHHPEVFNKSHIGSMFERYKKGFEQEKYLMLMNLKAIAEKFPSRLVDFFPQLCEDSIWKNDSTSVTLRCGIIACVGDTNEKLGRHAVDQLIKYIDSTDSTVAQIAVRELSALSKKHQKYMQKYKSKLSNVEATSTVPQLKDMIHDIILVLEGKSVEHIAEDVQQQQEEIAVIDTKVDKTIDTVIGIGDKVIEHDKEIGELGEGLDRVNERVDDVEEDLGETKVKVEEIDNKTMSNAPKWSRDLTKLMNPIAENDWRLLASRLGYSNDDIRGWATQHDPCMALLSEWYATHKTSEASFGVLNVLTEINRMDAAVIVENAMKAAEGVVEDEEFEYPSPPPVFISYQWGFQNEVKLLKQHLNMAGYECWMDIGQMGGGDKLFTKIDNGIRGAKVVICCVTEKYAQSPNCNREVNLSVNLNKPIIPLLMAKMDWPPKGSMGPIFSEYLFIRFFQRGGEETPEKDQRYWPLPKFQELLMQLNFFVVPDQKMVQKMYARWWEPIVEDINVDKNRGKKRASEQKPKQTSSQIVKEEQSPLVFLSYQWGKQPQVKALYQRLTSMGYSVWMDIYQMGGGDSLYDKIDRGMRGCRAVVSCVTQKYSLSANCRREVSLADALKKPIIPLLLEQMKWPPDGPMSMVFTELLYINFYRDEVVQTIWKGEQFDELIGKLGQFVPEIDATPSTNVSNERGTTGKGSTGNAKGKAATKSTEKNSIEKEVRKENITVSNHIVSKRSESNIKNKRNGGSMEPVENKLGSTSVTKKSVLAKTASVNAIAGKRDEGKTDNTMIEKISRNNVDREDKKGVAKQTVESASKSNKIKGTQLVKERENSDSVTGTDSSTKLATSKSSNGRSTGKEHVNKTSVQKLNLSPKENTENASTKNKSVPSETKSKSCVLL